MTDGKLALNSNKKCRVTPVPLPTPKDPNQKQGHSPWQPRTATGLWGVEAEAGLFIMKWKQPKRPPANEWVNKMYIHTRKYYLPTRKNEVPNHATTWMDPEDMMLSERSLSQKATYCWIPFIRTVQKRQIHRDRK